MKTMRDPEDETLGAHPEPPRQFSTKALKQITDSIKCRSITGDRRRMNDLGREKN